VTLRTRIFLPVFGLLALGASVGLARQDAAAAAARTWPPFVLVAGLLLIGAVAYEDGTFQAAGRCSTAFRAESRCSTPWPWAWSRP